MFDSDVPDIKIAPDTTHEALPKLRRRMGQALVEYVLIVVLVSLAIIAVLTATGPAIGNVFSNVVYNLLGETSVPYATLDSPQFWNYVTAVAQYKPDVSSLQTNTPIGYATNTPLPTSTSGPSPTPTNTLTPTTTSTVGPSPTPVDISYSLPFVDTADESAGSTKWHYQFTDAFAAAPWTVGFFTGASWNSSGAFGGSQPNATHVCTTNLASVVPCFSDVNTSWVASPDTGVTSSNWSAQYIYSGAPFEGREYQVTFQLAPTDGVVFKIGPTQVVSMGPGTSVVGAYNQLISPVSFEVAAGNYPVEVDFFAGAGSSHSIKLNFSTLADTGTCTWGTLNPGHSPNLSWQDANGGNYAVTSNCNLRLRGSIDLSTASTGNTRLTFFDKWNIAANAVAQVGVRNYNFTSNNDWTWATVHTSGSQGNNWAYQVFDLSNFGPTNVNFMTGTKRVEIAFRVQNNDPAVTAPGWFVDDITVEDNTVNNFTVPVSDNSDTPSVLQWTPTCNWAVTTEKQYPSGVGHSWSASPGTNYSPNSDCSLYLNGVIDLTPYGPLNPIVPQLLFYNQYYLTGVNTTLSVEYASISNRNLWTALDPLGSSNPWIAQGTNTVAAWTLETFNLNNLPKDKYYFRFRFVSDSTAVTAAGWYIDNIQWRERPVQAVGIPFAETFSNSDNWTMSDHWGLSNLTGGADGNPHQTDAYSLTDSPNGQLYVIPSPGSTNTAQYTPQIIMSSASPGFNPVMQFWTRWDIAATATLYLEGSIDGGLSWGASPLWSYSYGASNTSPFDTNVGNFNTNKAWTRYLVPLQNAYSGWPCTTTCTNLSIRFRLVSTSPAADGMFIGDIAVYDAASNNQSFTNSVACQATGVCNPSPQTIASNPFTDNFEAGLNNWYVGGDWAITSSSAHSGSHSFTSNTSATYTTPANAVLEIAPTLDFTGVNQPIVSFWTKYAISPVHQISVEVSKDGGSTWGSTQVVWITQPNVAQASTSTGTNLGWTRQMLSLTAVTGSVKQIRVRFRLNGLTTDPGSQGWFMDDVYIGPLASLSGYNNHGMDFHESFGNLANQVVEGNWTNITDWGPYDYVFPSDNFQPISDTYGGTLSNPLWDANYYHYYSTDATFPTSGSGNTWTLPTVGQICGVNAGSQISNYAQIGAVTPVYTTDATMPLVTYNGTGGGSAVVVANSETGVKVTGSGNGFSFTVTGGLTIRTLNVYVGAKGTANPTFTASLPVSAPVYTDSTLVEGSGTTTITRKYTITYSAAAEGQLLTVSFVAADAGQIKLEGASLSLGATNAVSNPSLVGGFVDLPSATAVNLQTEGTSDFAHWGADGAIRFDDKTVTACVKGILHQQESVINHTWDATHIPANAAGNAAWTTDRSDNTYFVASYARKFTVLTAGTYRFWSQADDAVRFTVDAVRVLPSTTTPYPWKSAAADDWIAPASGSYFYEAVLSAGVHTLGLDYFQLTGSASLSVQGSEQTTMLHSSGKGVPYSANQDTGAYTSGYITVQPSSTQTTTLNFYERYVVGSTAISSDTMYVAVSLDGGFSWIALNNYVTHIVLTGNTSSVNPVTYGYNLGDSPGVSPFTTFQNWQLHTVNLSNLLVSAAAPSTISGTILPAVGVGTPLISTTVPTNILIKFELDTRVSTVQGDGWYIANLNLVQN